MAEATLRAAPSLAATLAEAVRAERRKGGGVDALMLEFSLDSREGSRSCVSPRRCCAFRTPPPATG